MFTYYQVSKKAQWEYVVDSPEAIAELITRQVPMVSVLAIKDPIQDDEEKHGKSYKGPFYVDIDREGDPEGSIASAQAFADKLQALDVADYHVYLSGKKGFHFTIPMEVFSAARPTKSLPLIYKEMAAELYVEGLDFAVYNEGRPRLWRATNVKRPDNGKYKVQISIEELYSLTPERYLELSQQPRKTWTLPNPRKSLKMETLFEASKSIMQKKAKARDAMEFVPDAELKKTVGEDGSLPRCIQTLIEKGDTKEGANFNQAAIQFAAYMVKADVKDWRKHATAMARNVKSSTYNTEVARLDELRKMVAYVAGTPRYGFSKAMLFSVMEPCRDCAICNGTVEDNQVVPEDHEEESDLCELPNGYYSGMGKAKRQVTTFTLEPLNKFVQASEDETFGDTRVGINAVIKVNGHKREKITIMEDAWASTRSFKQAIQGKSNYAFYGNETDLQKIQHRLFRDEANMDEINYVTSLGIHRHKIGDRTVLVYVEPGFSVSSIKERNTHQVWGSIPSAPKVQEASYPEPSEDLKEFIDRMIDCNEHEITCTLIGWLAACHIKTQMMMRDNQFPIINLWGNAGSGKTSLAQLFAHLHAVDYMLEHSPMSLQGTTPWAVAQYCSTSETVVRLLDEFNEREIPGFKYDGICGLLKAAWNRQTFGKGSIQKGVMNGQQVSGAKVDEVKISGPICVMSEQSPERPAIRQRMIQLNVRKVGRDSEAREANFLYVADNRHMMTGLARAMVWQSLKTHPQWVADTMNLMKPLVPREIEARPQYAYQAVLTGVEFFCDTLSAIGLDEEYVLDTKAKMRNAILSKLRDTLDDVRVEKSRTEISLVITQMGLMAQGFDSALPWALQETVHYVRDKQYLYIDPMMCHTFYTRWARQSGDKVIISSLPQFNALIKQEDFYVEHCVHALLLEGKRAVIKLSVEKLKERGIDVEMFKEL